MHMADALLSPSVGATFWAGSVLAISYASKKLNENIDDRTVPLMGVLGAFIFAAQMINFTIPGTGSSGHLGGGMILAVLLGPFAAFLVMASVLTVQALFFADGGLLALGCTIWNLGIYPCFIAYPLVYRPVAGDGRSARRVFLACLIAAIAGLQMGAFSVVLQTLLSGRSELPFGTFVLFMQPIHLAIGIVEGVVTAAVISYVRTARPELLESLAAARPLAFGASLKKVLLAFAVLAIVAAGALSWFASTRPDGLEWAIERVLGRAELPESGQGAAGRMKTLQERTTIMPDYRFKEAGKDGDRQGSDAGTSVAGLLGAVMVLTFTVLAGLGIKALKKRSHRPTT